MTTIYAGTVGNRHFYTDDKDCLPPDIRDYRRFELTVDVRDLAKR